MKNTFVPRFGKVNGDWRPARSYKLGDAFSAGDWNVGPGGGRFTAAMRKELTLSQRLRALREAGCTHVEFHSTEAPPRDLRKIKTALRQNGLKVAMVTANLFKLQRYVGGNLGHPNQDVRDAAIQDTIEYINFGIEHLDADVYVYWNGSSGYNVPLGKNPLVTYRHIAISITIIVRAMVRKYGAEKALLFCIEPKFNEPPSWGLPADVGEALTIIGMLPDDVQPFVGVNPETCHSKIGLKPYPQELALAQFAHKLFHVHLNDGSGAKFDEDRPFGFDWPTAVWTVNTLIQGDYTGIVGFDVQPFPADTDDQQAESVRASIEAFGRAMRACELIDQAYLAEVQQRDKDQVALQIFNRAVRMGRD